MTDIPKEAVKAALSEYERFEKGNLDGLPKPRQILRRGDQGAWDTVGLYDSREERDAALPFVRMQAALTAVLPFLAPQPSECPCGIAPESSVFCSAGTCLTCTRWKEVIDATCAKRAEESARAERERCAKIAFDKAVEYEKDAQIEYDAKCVINEATCIGRAQAAYRISTAIRAGAKP